MTAPTAIAFTVSGPPVPYARTRRSGGTGHAFIPRKQRDYRAHVAACLAVEMLNAQLHEPLRGALVMRLHIHCGSYVMGDASNFAKIVEDVCQGPRGAFVDDVQIVDLIVHRYLDRERPRIRVYIEQLGAEHDVRVPKSKRRPA